VALPADCGGRQSSSSRRAVEASDSRIVKQAREDGDVNVLALSGWNISFDKQRKIIDAFLKTKFSGKERHIRRIGKIKKYESGIWKEK